MFSLAGHCVSPVLDPQVRSRIVRCSTTAAHKLRPIRGWKFSANQLILRGSKRKSIGRGEGCTRRRARLFSVNPALWSRRGPRLIERDAARKSSPRDKPRASLFRTRTHRLADWQYNGARLLAFSFSLLTGNSSLGFFSSTFFSLLEERARGQRSELDALTWSQARHH